MKTKQLTLAAVLLGAGTVLHGVIPGIVFGVKPDFLLVMVFCAIWLNLELGYAIAIGLIGGVLAALTTNFPMGQIPNILDKLVVVIVMYCVMKLLAKYMGNIIVQMIVFAFGTIVSGLVFLISAKYLVGLPGGAEVLPLFIAVVLPAALANAVFGSIILKLIMAAQLRMK